MEAVLQFSVLALSVCVGALALVKRAGTRSSTLRISVDPVSSTWLVDHRARSRPE